MTTSLPYIPPTTRLTPLILRISGGNPSKFTLQGTNTYLLGRGPERLLIDTGQGFPIWKETLLAVLRAEKASIKTVLLTHHHHDHITGLRDIPREYHHHHHQQQQHGGGGGGGGGHGSSGSVSVEVWRHPALPSSDVSRNMLKQTLDAWGQGVRPLVDGMSFQIPGADDGVTLQTVYAPGHTPDHCAFLLQHHHHHHHQQRSEIGGQQVSPILFTGDAVLGHGTAVFEDLTVYIESLYKMQDVISRVASDDSKVQAYPAHGEVIEDAVVKLQEYISHRAQREREVIDILKQNGRSSIDGDRDGILPIDMVKTIYKDYPESLHAPAEGGLKLILKKLEGESKAQVRNERWTWVDDAGGDRDELDVKASLL